jgi:hypothetical protein
MKLSDFPASLLQQTNIYGCMIQEYADPVDVMKEFDNLPKRARDYLNTIDFKICILCAANVFYMAEEIERVDGMMVLRAMVSHIRTMERTRLRRERMKQLIKEQQERIARSRGRI